MEKDSFIDLEKVRLDILKMKIQYGIDEFNSNTGQQWTQVRFEKPLLETLLTLIEKEINIQFFATVEKEGDGESALQRK